MRKIKLVALIAFYTVSVFIDAFAMMICNYVIYPITKVNYAPVFIRQLMRNTLKELVCEIALRAYQDYKDVDIEESIKEIDGYNDTALNDAFWYFHDLVKSRRK